VSRASPSPLPPPASPPFWARPVAAVLAELDTSAEGLEPAEAARRLVRFGPNRLEPARRRTRLGLRARQLSDPLVLVLIVAAGIAAMVGEWPDAAVVLLIVGASAGLGWWREVDANRAIEELQQRIHLRTRVLRGGVEVEIPVEEVVPGDLLLLSAGSLVPADARVIEATDFFVSQAALTGETFPVPKDPAAVAAEAPVADRTDAVWLGTSVRSGLGRCVAVRTGRDTAYGAIAARLRTAAPETEFARGLHRFGTLLWQAMLALVLLVLGANVALHRPFIDSLLFSVALAVGLTPELLPAILTVNLARNARAMAREGVLVRRLPAIENLGSMDVLCTDKTGTLTEGVVVVQDALDPQGQRSAVVLELVARNAALQVGLANPIDAAILQRHRPALEGLRKVGEIPYDFVRRSLSVIVEEGGAVRLIAKGAVGPVLDRCTHAAGQALDEAGRAVLLARAEAWAEEGLRVLAVATRELPPADSYGRQEEQDLDLAGFLCFSDPPKEGGGSRPSASSATRASP